MGKPLEEYLEYWRHIFRRRRALRWQEEGWLHNGYCRLCRYCCGPQDSDEPFPMRLLPEQMVPGYEKNFFLLDASTAFLDARGCRAVSGKGCRLPRALRPVSCGLFPFVLNAGGLYVYKTCPAVLLNPFQRIFSLGGQAAHWLTRLDRERLEGIALNLPTAVLAEKYISLNLRIYGSWGVGIRTE